MLENAQAFASRVVMDLQGYQRVLQDLLAVCQQHVTLYNQLRTKLRDCTLQVPAHAVCRALPAAEMTLEQALAPDNGAALSEQQRRALGEEVERRRRKLHEQVIPGFSQRFRELREQVVHVTL